MLEKIIKIIKKVSKKEKLDFEKNSFFLAIGNAVVIPDVKSYGISGVETNGKILRFASCLEEEQAFELAYNMSASCKVYAVSNGQFKAFKNKKEKKTKKMYSITNVDISCECPETISIKFDIVDKETNASINVVDCFYAETRVDRERMYKDEKYKYLESIPEVKKSLDKVMSEVTTELLVNELNTACHEEYIRHSDDYIVDMLMDRVY